MNAYKRYANKLKSTKETIAPNVKMSSEAEDIEKLQMVKSNNLKEIYKESSNINTENNNQNTENIPILNISKVDINNLSINQTNTTPSKKDYLKKFDFNIFKTKIYEKHIAERHFVLSEEMINLGEYDEEGRNVLHRAAFQQKLDIVKSITKNITKSDIIDKKDMYGNTALLLACKNFNFQKDIAIRLEIIKTLLKRNADVNAYEPINLWTPLHWLAFNGDENSLSLLINKGAVYFLPDKEGYFPIDLAGIKNYSKIVELIIQEFLAFMDTVGEFVVLDPNVLGRGSKRVKSRDLVRKISQGNLEEIKSDEEEVNVFDKGADKGGNSKTNFLKILNFKKKNSVENNIFVGDKYNTAEDLGNNEHDDKEKSFTSESSNSLSNSHNNDSENEDDEAANRQKKIHTNLHLVDPVLQTILIKIFSHHCLYWASYYKINTMYVNKLITLYNANPSFKLYSVRLQTPIHGACLNGNLMAFKLLLNKFNDNVIEKKIKIQKDLAKFAVRKSKTMIQEKFNFFTNLVSIVAKTQEQTELKKYRKLVKKDTRFKLFTKKFKKYVLDLVKKVFHLEENPKKKKVYIEKDIINLQDKKRNTPLHLAASNGKFNFIKNLLETDLLERPLDQFFNQINKEGFSGYALLKEENLINRILLKSGKAIYNIPLVVLELLKNDHSKIAINLIMKLALVENLKVVLMEHENKSKVYICLDITDDIFKVQAEKEKLKVKMLDQNLKKTFENNEDFIASAEPFFSRQKQDIILKMMSNILDLKLLKDQNILLKIFYTHKPSATHLIYKLWLDHPWYFPNPFRMFRKMMSDGKEIYYDEINILYRYFGEKRALYYAFVTFFLNFLLFIAVFSLAFCLYYNQDIFTSNTMFPIYSVLFLFWQIIFIEAWKRKNAEITHKWGINEMYNLRELRPNFKGDEYYKDLNGKLEKHQTNTKKIILLLLSLPIIIGLLAAVIIIFYYATQFQNKYANTQILRYVPAIAKSLSIIIINLVYDNVARLFTNLENHKYQETYENAIIAKIFSFNIVSNLTAVIYTTIISKGAEDLKSLLYTLIITKLAMDPVTNVLVPYLKIKLFSRHYFSKSREAAMEYNQDNDPRGDIEKDNNADIMKIVSNTSVGLNSRGNIERNSESSSRLNRDEEKFKEFANALKDKHEIKNKIKFPQRNNRNPNHIEANPQETRHPFNIKYFRKVKIINGEEEIFYSAQDINPDFIELNNIMPERLEIVYYYGNICLLLTVSSLFSIVIPLAPVLIIIFATISQYFNIYADIYIFKRPKAERAMNIGLWLEIIDIISTVSIIFNAFLFYYYNANEFNVYTRYITKAVLSTATSSEFSVGQGETALLVIALGEHVMILLKYFLRYIIPDVPVWVSKERELLLMILEDSNKEKEELHNQAVDNVIEQQLKIFNTTIDGKNKEIIKIKENLNKNFDVLKIYKEELEKTNTKINQVEFINKVLSEKNEKLENVRKEYTNYLNDRPEKIKANIKEGLSSQNLDFVQGLQVNKILSNLDGNINNRSSNDKNSVKQIPQRKLGKKDFEETIDFKFDRTLQKITRDILRGRQIVLQDEMSEMRKNINKLYILSLLKNTFDRIEKEILVKKFEKCIQLIDKPIVLCNQCNTSKIQYYCIDCEEKLCQSCKEVHLSNALWEKHKCQAIIDEFELTANAVKDKAKDKKDMHSKLILSEDSYAPNLNTQVKKEEESAMYMNMFKRRTIRASIKASGNGQKNTLMQKLRKKGIIHNKKLFNPTNTAPNLDSNQLADNKPRNAPSSNTNLLLKKSPEQISFGLFQKMESFCFPTNLYNLNFENLSMYFAYIKREYIDFNGINSDNTVDTKKFIENKIDYSAKFFENPNSVLQDDFTNILSNSIFNFEEQFLINRIAFYKFKEYGSKLEVSNVLEILKILQESTYEEKLKVILNLMDIHGNKLIIKSELEKLLVFMVVQNEEKNFRIGAIIDEIFGKKNVIEYDKLYHICLENVVNRELFCEILQINE